MPNSPKPLARVFSPFFPFPPTEGGTQFIFGHLLDLCETHRVQLVCWKSSPEDVKKRRQTPWIDAFPEDIEVVFIKTKTEKSKFSRAIRIIKCLFGKYASVEEFYFPDLIEIPYLERADLEVFHYSLCLKWLQIKGLSNAVKRVSYFLNIEAEIFEQRAKDEKNPINKLILNRFTSQLRRNEIAVAGLVDECWMLSQVDLRHLSKCGITNAVFKPPVFSKKLSQTRQSLRAKRAPSESFTVGLIGGLEFKPNADSALFVLEKLCPEIAKRKIPCQILIVGRHPTQYMLDEAQRYPFAKVMGFLESLDTFWTQIDCMLVPQFSGSGVRIKLLESIASGVDTIANPSACEPLSDEVRNSPLLHIVNTDQFADKLEELIERKRATQPNLKGQPETHR